MLDARDLLTDPPGVLASLCEALGVPFDAAMLAWPTGKRDTDGIWAKHWYDSVERSTGAPPAIVPQMGGSICNDLFTDLLGLPAIWIPHSYAACSQHAPDEHILMPLCREALALMAGLYWDLGRSEVSHPGPAD